MTFLKVRSPVLGTTSPGPSSRSAESKRKTVTRSTRAFTTSLVQRLRTITCEVQVRTLMEEVWGEVDHKLNYPVPTQILALKEQLKVLARVTSSASRLVDSIFLTHEDATRDENAEDEAEDPG